MEKSRLSIREDLDKKISYYEKIIRDTKIVVIGWEKCLETLKKQRRKQDGIN